MSTNNVFDFLKARSQADLKQRGILRGITNQLKSQSVDPLIMLMRECGINRLEYPELNWFLDVEGNFKNLTSAELKEGRIVDLSNRGNVFNYKNSYIQRFLI
jgi:hypothetical protein